MRLGRSKLNAGTGGLELLPVIINHKVNELTHSSTYREISLCQGFTRTFTLGDLPNPL